MSQSPEPEPPSDADASAAAGVDAAGSSESAPPKPRKKKKKAKRSAQAPHRPELDAQGRYRPAFLLNFPDDPELERLIAAYEAGNYAYVREHASELAERASDPGVRDAALELRQRIDPDPLVKYLLFAAMTLLAFLIAWAYLAPH